MSRTILLTFDDGPHPEHTPMLLDVLAARDIKALFFVIGEKLETEAGHRIATRMHREGHMIGNHTYSHPDLTTLSEDKIHEELFRTHELIASISGHSSVFRPPYGSTDFTVQKVATDLGYFQMLWNVDTFDWKFRDRQPWIEPALEQISFRSRSLVLLHDIHKTTVERVPAFIDAILTQDSLSFVKPENLAFHRV